MRAGPLDRAALALRLGTRRTATAVVRRLPVPVADRLRGPPPGPPSALRERLADRIVVAVAPLLLGTGTDAVGDLGAGLVRDGLQLRNQTVHQLGPDLLVASDVVDSLP